MIYSSFGVFSSGGLWVVPNFSSYIKNGKISDIKPVEVANGFQWPNDVKIVPSSVFGSDSTYFVVPDGFLVPFHNDGGIYIVKTTNADITKKVAQYTLTTDKPGYFYHNGYWADMNKDGLLDFVTARSDATEGHGELIWLEHPK